MARGEFKLGESEFGSKFPCKCYHCRAVVSNLFLPEDTCLIDFNIHYPPPPPADILKPLKSGCALRSVASDNQCQSGLKSVLP